VENIQIESFKGEVGEQHPLKQS